MLKLTVYIETEDRDADDKADAKREAMLDRFLDLLAKFGNVETFKREDYEADAGNGNGARPI